MSKWLHQDIEKLKDIITNSVHLRDVLIKINRLPSGSNYKTLHSIIQQHNIDISHFIKNGSYKVKYKPREPNRKLNEILVENSTYNDGTFLKKRLLKNNTFEYKCYNCNSTKWLEQPIPLELEHKNGNNRDHRIENLTLLCPNCHALTATYRGRNKKNYKELLKEKLLTNTSSPPIITS